MSLWRRTFFVWLFLLLLGCDSGGESRLVRATAERCLSLLASQFGVQTNQHWRIVDAGSHKYSSLFEGSRTEVTFVHWVIDSNEAKSIVESLSKDGVHLFETVPVYDKFAADYTKDWRPDLLGTAEAFTFKTIVQGNEVFGLAYLFRGETNAHFFVQLRAVQK